MRISIQEVFGSNVKFMSESAELQFEMNIKTIINTSKNKNSCILLNLYTHSFICIIFLHGFKESGEKKWRPWSKPTTPNFVVVFSLFPFLF